MKRRTFLRQALGVTGLALIDGAGADAAYPARGENDTLGVLVDTTLCVGCRSCEKACNQINQLPRRPEGWFKDESVFQTRRRMEAESFTVVNRYASGDTPGSPVYVKFQCMHCLRPACVSACIVGALSREASGAVIYDAWKCIGCRYCMAACPFQVPAYEFDNALTPRVRKCTFCFETRLSEGNVPACVEACPMQVMTFERRVELIALARRKIETCPDRYLPNIYGEHEVGGTAWLYLSGIPFEELDFPRLGYCPAPEYTEPIQHTIFKWFLPPLGLYATLGSIMWFLRNRKEREDASTRKPKEHRSRP